MKINVNTTWIEVINAESKKDYFKKLMHFINLEYDSNKVIYPKKDKIFRCFNFFNYSDLSVVILGQDPYYSKGMADGLAFSCSNGLIPKSLQNIFNEINRNLNVNRTNPNLEDIAKQNVLLLNTCLTVEENLPLSHSNIGWEVFVDNVIKFIDQKCNNVIFLLMGNNAFKKEKIITNRSHIIFKTSHPSPLSFKKEFKDKDKKAFYCSNVFKDINDTLLTLGKNKLNW